MMFAGWIVGCGLIFAGWMIAGAIENHARIMKGTKE